MSEIVLLTNLNLEDLLEKIKEKLSYDKMEIMRLQGTEDFLKKNIVIVYFRENFKIYIFTYFTYLLLGENEAYKEKLDNIIKSILGMLSKRTRPKAIPPI